MNEATPECAVTQAIATRYTNAADVVALKAHMQALHRARRQGTGKGQAEEYFLGMMQGLVLVDAVDPAVLIELHEWIAQGRYRAE